MSEVPLYLGGCLGKMCVSRQLVPWRVLGEDVSEFAGYRVHVHKTPQPPRAGYRVAGTGVPRS
jgi:hypothetical protein